eukprot:TRINITY_DN20688_c0_g3_i1.p1 TRINITY_DN20688_c0_g3~~TRINITY_DN20688_c0_g3_i1.p1  ORF type:complete len:726 (+),score=127.24 TRINITY_DN20688_c0_g3_i1:39-2216(+)
MEDLSPIYALIQKDLEHVVKQVVDYVIRGAPESGGGGGLAAENAKLRAEITRLQALTGESKGGNALKDNNALLAPTEAPASSPKKGSKEPPPADEKKRKSQNMKKSGNEEQDKAAAAPKNVFPDANAMKEKLRANLAKTEYSVLDLYKSEGWAQWVARHPIFDNFTLFVIAFNSLWIAIDTDLNTGTTLLDAEPGFVIADNFFCVYFCFELFVRFSAFKTKRNCLKDMWFCFDSGLVTMMVLETWVMTIVFLLLFGGSGTASVNLNVLKMVRMVRLTRMARMARLLRALPELVIMLKGIVVASRSVFFTLLLLVLIMYLFAICVRQLADQVSEPGDAFMGEKFYSVPVSMWTLLLDGVLPDNAGLILDCAAVHPVLGVITIIFVLLAALTVMNMLVGVLCEVVSVVSSVERETMQVNYVKHQLFRMIDEQGIDRDANGHIDKNEFNQLLMKPEAARIIQDVGVDVVGLVDVVDYIFQDSPELSFMDFMDLVYQLRGANVCTVKDVVDLRRYMASEMGKLKSELHGLGVRPQAFSTEFKGGLALGSATTPQHFQKPTIGSELQLLTEPYLDQFPLPSSAHARGNSRQQDTRTRARSAGFQKSAGYGAHGRANVAHSPIQKIPVDSMRERTPGTTSPGTKGKPQVRPRLPAFAADMWARDDYGDAPTVAYLDPSSPVDFEVPHSPQNSEPRFLMQTPNIPAEVLDNGEAATRRGGAKGAWTGSGPAF